ncbi:MAG TPA: winged helix-turn-helix domain-containing protein [Candidatus Saccharibacteria bacterium]|nr:winged helix-turn-helix domain-containing protein [Candidatus Saccharibacteria bacterium]HRQ98046.1 winged helix-turn-helix domain-containing protein [Candidatus Saccharibacteria bacterium]
MKLTRKPKSDISTSEERLMYSMQLLGDKTRYKLFKLLMLNNEMCVSDIATELNISVSAVSQHFSKFEMVGLVDKERMGQKICYMLKPDDALTENLISIINKS